MREQFVRQTVIRAPRDVVFAFHASREALEKLIPPWDHAEVTQPPTSLEVGTRVKVRTRFAGVWLTWEALHTEYVLNELFADKQVTGPFAYWYHRHVFTDTAPGVSTLSDEIEYELPMGFLGRAVAGRMIRNRLERMFAYRHKITRECCEHTTEP